MLLRQRAESNAKKDQLLITESTYQVVKDFVVAEKLEPIQVKGKHGLQTFWCVKGLKSERSEQAA